MFKVTVVGYLKKGVVSNFHSDNVCTNTSDKKALKSTIEQIIIRNLLLLIINIDQFY